MNLPFVDIHTHRPTGHGIELRTAGIHPWEAGKEPVEAALRELEAELAQGGAEAIGEIGLDFARAMDEAARKSQIALFRAQLDLARRRGLPVVLHCVKAFEETMRLLREQEPRAAIFHGFIGSPQQARRAVERGYYLSFGERAFASPRTLEAMKETPLSRLFFETDESDTPVETIYKRAATHLGMAVETLQRAAVENYDRIFTHG